jgi:sporulation protein YlmC with PRC-barrel domain
MRKFANLRTLTILLSCLFITSFFTRWGGVLAEAAVPLSQQQSASCAESEPMTEETPGMIARPKGAEIGAVKDLILDLEAGRIAYAVGVFDQIGKLRNRVFVLPWGIVKVDPEISTFTLSEGKTVLADAPSFALATWTNLPTSQWTGIVTAYWKKKLGPDFTAAGASDVALSKASDLVGVTIKDPAGKDVGTIEELMLDSETGELVYTVLSVQDIERSNRMVFFALPWNMVQVNPVQHVFIADIDKQMFSESLGVARERLGITSSAGSLERGGAQTQSP